MNALKTVDQKLLIYLFQKLTFKISSSISKYKNDYFIRPRKKLGDPSRFIKSY